MVIVFGVFFTPNEYRDVINHLNNLSLFHLQLKLSAEAFGGESVRVGAKAPGKYFTLGLALPLTLVRLEGVLHPRVKS
jgi:hypothetical protein